MSDHTSPSPYEVPHGSPKAAAKAARAYAKAMRPWYKKKRFIIPAALVALGIAGSAGSSSESTSTTPADTGAGGTTASAKVASAGGSAKAAKAGDGKHGKVGQALTNAGTTYEVTSVRTADKIGDPDLLGAAADGRFVIVSLELTNNKDETKTFSDAMAKIVTADGKEYETSDKAVLSFGDDSLLLKDIQPELTTRGKVAFDLPPAKLGSSLVIEDLWGTGEISVDLGL